MKKLLLIFGFVLFYSIVNGQSVYQPYYHGQSQGSSQNQQQESSNEYSQSVRTTAYSEDYNGTVYKMPIKVQQKQSYGVSTYYVIEYYDNSGHGIWREMPVPSMVSKCYRSVGNKNSMENKFMYKALINGKTYYFDL